MRQRGAGFVYLNPGLATAQLMMVQSTRVEDSTIRVLFQHFRAFSPSSRIKSD